MRAISASEVKDFSVGFFTGMGVNEAVPDAQDCIMAAENLVTELKVNKSFVHFFEIMKTFFTNAPKCFSSATQSDEYVQKIIHLFDKNAIEDTLTSALISRKKVVSDFNEGKEQLDAKVYFLAGAKFGDIFRILFNPMNFPSFAIQNNFLAITVANSPVTPKKCEHSADAKDMITLSELALDEPAAKGKVNNITIKGVMKEYQDLDKVTLKTYLMGIRMDSRDVPAANSLDAG